MVDAIPALHASVHSPVPPVIGTVEAIKKQPSRSGSFHGLEAPRRDESGCSDRVPRVRGV